MKSKAQDSLPPWPKVLGIQWSLGRLVGSYAALILLIPFLVLFVDLEMILWVRENMTPELTLVSKYGTLLGDAAQYLSISMILFLIFKYLPSQKLGWLGEEKLYLRQASLFAFFSFIFSGILVHIGKFSFGRQRPYMSDNLDHLVFDPFNTDYTFHSFPSGHSQTIFTLVALLSLFWPKYNGLYLVLGIIVALTRITLYNHFLSDILVGGAVGVTGVILTYRYLYKREALPYQMRLHEEPASLEEGLSEENSQDDRV